MDKCCVYALRKAIGVTAVIGSVISLLLAFDLHVYGTSLSAWNETAGDDKQLYIKLFILAALALGFGVASLKHFRSKLGTYIPAVIGVIFMVMCAVSFTELIVFFSVSAILTLLSIATLFEREVPVMRWEKAPNISLLDYDY